MKNDQEIPPADGTLTRASLSGGFWSTVNTVATKSLGAAKTIILARLLFPEDFGLIGLALVIVGTVSRFSLSRYIHGPYSKTRIALARSVNRMVDSRLSWCGSFPSGFSLRGNDSRILRRTPIEIDLAGNFVNLLIGKGSRA